MAAAAAAAAAGPLKRRRSSSDEGRWPGDGSKQTSRFHPGYLALHLPIGDAVVDAHALAFKERVRSWLQARLDTILPEGHTHRVPSFASDATLTAYFICKVPGLSPKVLRRAWDNEGNAQFHPWQGYRKSGFGIQSAQRDFAIFLEVVRAAKAALEAETGHPFEHTSSLAHLIAKFPGGGKLAEHIDGGSMAEMVAKCVLYRDDADFEQWATREGRQILAHYKITSGHTGFIKWLTPRRFLVMLLLWLHEYALAPPLKKTKKTTDDPDRVTETPLPADFAPPAVPAFHAAGGPVFQDFKKMIAPTNAVLEYLERAAAGRTPQQIIDGAPTQPMRECFVKMHAAGHLAYAAFPEGYAVPPPLEAAIMAPEGAATKPMVIAWPKGAPHWAEDAKEHARFTVTVPLQENGAKPKPDARGFAFLRRSAKIKATGDPALLEELRQDNTPWAGGIVHKNPGRMAAETFENFRDLKASPDEVDAYVAAMMS